MIYADRVQETTTTTGTGTLTLAGAVAGYRTFTSAFATGDKVRYSITNGTDWEVGDGTILSSTTLSRDQVFASSNSNAAVSFSAGSKNVWSDLPAQDIVNPGLALALINRM